ncbi:MAG: hypothetical protein NTY57_04275 [Solirubrobacterales bacterium]|nr:hypothetical protein [Solirubrobacterales bacterium]
MFYFDSFLEGSTGLRLVAHLAMLVPAFIGLTRIRHSFHPKIRGDAQLPLLSLGAALLAVWMIREAGIDPIITVGIIGTACGLVERVASLSLEKSACLYLGALVGLTSPVALHGIGPIIAAGLVAGLLWSVLHPLVPMIGGRIGLTVFAAVFAVWLVAIAEGWQDPGIMPPDTNLLNKALVLAVALSAAQVTHQLLKTRVVGVVGASALPTGLFAVGLLLVPETWGVVTGTLSVTWIGGSFIGMTGSEWTQSRWVLPVASVALGIFTLGSGPTLMGLGGGSGTTAVISVLIGLGICAVTESAFGLASAGDGLAQQNRVVGDEVVAPDETSFAPVHR